MNLLNVLDLFKGYKTPLAGIGLIVLGLWLFFTNDDAKAKEQALGYIGVGLGIIGLHFRLPRIPNVDPKGPTGAPALLLPFVLLVAGCAGLSPSQSPQSPGTAAAPATATQGAQTVTGQQGQAPSTSAGGTATVNWIFASQTTADIQRALIEFAAANKASTDDLTKLLAATNGAPDSVTITVQDLQAQGGDSSSIPSGTGGGAGASGSGTVTRP